MPSKFVVSPYGRVASYIEKARCNIKEAATGSVSMNCLAHIINLLIFHIGFGIARGRQYISLCGEALPKITPADHIQHICRRNCLQKASGKVFNRFFVYFHIWHLVAFILASTASAAYMKHNYFTFQRIPLPLDILQFLILTNPLAVWHVHPWNEFDDG